MDIAGIIAAKQPRRETVTVILDADIELALTAAEQAVDAARNRLLVPKLNPAAPAALGAAQAELDRLRADAEAVSARFVFQAVGRQRFSDLRGEHPPTKEQRTEWTARWLKAGVAEHQIPELEHNPDTFPPVLLAAACIEPEMTLGDATGIWCSAGWSDAELAELFGAALAVNTQHRRHDLGNSSR